MKSQCFITKKGSFWAEKSVFCCKKGIILKLENKDRYHFFQWVRERGYVFWSTHYLRVYKLTPYTHCFYSFYMSYPFSGEEPRLGKHTLQSMLLTGTPDDESGFKGSWSGQIAKAEGDSVTVTVTADARSPVGKWRLMVHTWRKDQPYADDKVKRHHNKEDIYVLFNPWCQGTFWSELLSIC